MKPITNNSEIQSILDPWEWNFLWSTWIHKIIHKIVIFGYVITCLLVLLSYPHLHRSAYSNSQRTVSFIRLMAFLILLENLLLFVVDGVKFIILGFLNFYPNFTTFLAKYSFSAWRNLFGFILFYFMFFLTQIYGTL